MKIKKALTCILTTSLALGIVGCSAPTKKYVDALENAGFEEVEFKEFKKSNPIDGDFEDGVYVVSNDAKTLKKLAKQIDSDVDTDDFKSIVFSEKSSKNMDDNYSLYVISFKSTDAAEDFFEDYSEELEDRMKEFKRYEDNGDIATDDDDNYFIGAADLEWYGSTAYVRIGCYLDGKDVICILMTATTDDAEDYVELTDDICDELDIINPSEAL